jgi:hypothetical protein
MIAKKMLKVVDVGAGRAGIVMDDKVALANSLYVELFGNRRAAIARTRPWQRRVVRIRVAVDAGTREIRRLFYGANSLGIDANTIGLDLKSCIELGIPASGETRITFELAADPLGDLGGRARFYWDHPVDATRVSFKLGLVGVGLGCLGCLISIASLVRPT